MSLDLILFIIGAILAIATGKYGTQYIKAKKILGDILDLISSVDKSIDDDKITKEELKKIIKEKDDLLNKAKKKTKKQ